jgi:hypothetical protein
MAVEITRNVAVNKGNKETADNLGRKLTSKKLKLG